MPRTTKEDYRRHYLDYQGKPEQIAKRSQRNQARAQVEKRVGAAALKGKDVGHKTSIKSGGSNASSNLRVQSVASNRGWQTPKKKQ
jgi:hypothetical protein